MTTRSALRALAALLLAAGSVATSATGCGVDDALVGGRCASGYTQCGLRCVEVSSDPENCGACGHVCVPGSGCTAGVCDSIPDGSPDSPSDAPPEEAALDGRPSEADGSAGEDAIISSADANPEDVGSGDAGSNEADPGETSIGESGSDDAPDAGSPIGDPVGGNDATVEGGVPQPEAGGQDATDAAGGDSTTSDSPVDEAGDGSTSSDGSDSGEAGTPCMAPLVYCGGACIDVTGDPLNCGGCNVVCASQLCDNSHCVGAASGGIVYIGHDYTITPPGTGQARVLSNAVFIPGSNPLHVMSYERYASASAVSHVDAILNGVANQLGRTLSIHATATDDDVRDQLTLPSYDVLLVHDQVGAPDMALATLGGNWSQTLTNFTLGGGVVIVLDGGTGIGQMPAFASGTGLLQVLAHAAMAVWTPLTVSSRLDVVGIGVVSPYAGEQSSVSVTTEANGGNVVYVVELASDAGAAPPVVVHKAFF